AAAQLLSQGESIEFLGLLDTHCVLDLEVPPAEADAATDLLDVVRMAVAGSPALEARLQQLQSRAAQLDFAALADECLSQQLVPLHLHGLSLQELRQAVLRQRFMTRAYSVYLPQHIACKVHLFQATGRTAKVKCEWQQVL